MMTDAEIDSIRDSALSVYYKDHRAFARAIEDSIVSKQRESCETTRLNAIANSIEKGIPSQGGRILAAMIREGVTELDSHVLQAVNEVRGALARRVRRWDRVLWGVQFNGSRADETPMLIGSLWATDLGGQPYAGEPTRALLFCTRSQARAWCVETLRNWRDGRQGDDIVSRWMVRPVRVRETVQFEVPSAAD